MTDTPDNVEEVEMDEALSEEGQEQSELETLKARATQLGITFHPNIGVDKLRDKVSRTLEPTVEPTDVPVVKAVPAGSGKAPLTEEEWMKKNAIKGRKSAGALVRIRVTCMNPNKGALAGEWFSVGSAKLGTYKKFIQFNEAWHVPRIVYEDILGRVCNVPRIIKLPGGRTRAEVNLVKEYAVEVLPRLTPKELSDLAAQQAASHSID